MSEQRTFESVQIFRVWTRRSNSGRVHIFDSSTLRRSLCNVTWSRREASEESSSRVQRQAFASVSCQTCRETYAKRLQDLILNLTCDMEPVTDYAADFLIDAQESQEHGLRWAPVILGALAEVLSSLKKQP